MYSVIINITSMIVAVVMWLLVFFNEPSMSAIIPMVFALILLAISLYMRMVYQRTEMVNIIAIIIFVNIAVGCKTFQEWGRGIPFIAPSLMMKIVMFLSLMLSGYVLFVFFKATSAFKGKWGNTNRHNIIVEEQTLQDRWTKFKRDLKRINPVESPDADLEGIFFELGETVREKER